MNAARAASPVYGGSLIGLGAGELAITKLGPESTTEPEPYKDKDGGAFGERSIKARKGTSTNAGSNPAASINRQEKSRA